MTTLTVALICEDPGCDRRALYNLRWVDAPRVEQTGHSLCAAHCNAELDRLGPADEHHRIGEPTDTLERAVSVRAAYAFDDWPPAPAADEPA